MKGQLFDMPEVLAYIGCGDGMLGRGRRGEVDPPEIDFLKKKMSVSGFRPILLCT